jgi:hypothetical protein
MTDATATAARLERCPNCNAKLPETPVSICPYCVFPLGTLQGPVSETGESPNRARIQRVSAHEKFAATEAIDPPENLEFQLGGQAIFRGKVLLTCAAVGVALGAILAGGGLFAHWITWLGVLVGIGGVVLIQRGQAARKQAVALPLLKRPGLVVDRRSDTRIKGWGGSTTYYFEIEFEDGTRAEFRYPGRGAQEDPYVNNLPGVAFTRGTDLLLFKHIRV